VDVTVTEAWREGRIEVQDLGSQLILASVGLSQGERWLDACAGAGGKTLQLARLLGGKGEIDAFDIRRGALDELARRAARAQLDNIGRPNDPGTAAIRILDAAPTKTYDGVLVDAPCSGSGTWRRAPHLKWVTTHDQIERAAALQRDLLHSFSARIKPGGRLVYATCSMSSRENEDVVTAFLASHPEFETSPFAATFGAPRRGPGLLISPALHDTDGFFVASLRRR
jgi:16S rRNA (cytosine967-C5)-methyltransferase